MATRFDPLFGALADDSDWFPSPAHILRRAAILDLIGDHRPGRFLDIGCGAGRWLVDWSRLGHTGTGVEPDDRSRELARKCVAEFDAGFDLVAAIDRTTHSSYDYLSAIEVLEHIDDPLGNLTEWGKSLKPGGWLIASVPAFRRLWGASDEWAGHVQRFEPEDFRALVEAAGFTVETCRLYGYPVGNLTRVLGNYASDLKRRRRRSEDNDRVAATLASGRDRSIEAKLRPLLMSLPTAWVLRLGIALQRRSGRSGIGIIVLARRAPEGAGERDRTTTVDAR